MIEENREKLFRDRVQALSPLVDNLRLMIAAARHAFNRHSLAQIDEMARRRTAITLDIDPWFEEVEAGLQQGSAADRPHLLKLKGILTHLELMAEGVAGLADHLRYKANRGIILSEEDLFGVNNLFSRLTGFMETLADILQTNDPALRAYVLEESQKLQEDCFRRQTAHEARMMDTPGQPDAWSVYLAILAASREIAGHLGTMVKSLT